MADIELLKHTAVADSYGAGFEFIPEAVVTIENDLSAFRFHQKFDIPAGHYTDDTQMSLAIAEVLISGEDWSAEVLAQKFVDVFKRDPRNGYAQGFYKFLQSVEDGEDFLARIRPESIRNGAAMRAVPMGIIQDETELIEKSIIQAEITHRTREGTDAAIAAALMSHFFVYHIDDKEKLPQYLDKWVPNNIYDWSEQWQGRVPCEGIATIRAAVTAVVQSDTLSSLLKNCVAFSGDVDSVAAIAVGSASCMNGMKQDIPENLWQNLENGEYGLQYIERLDRKLNDLVTHLR